MELQVSSKIINPNILNFNKDYVISFQRIKLFYNEDCTIWSMYPYPTVYKTVKTNIKEYPHYISYNVSDSIVKNANTNVIYKYELYTEYRTYIYKYEIGNNITRLFNIGNTDISSVLTKSNINADIIDTYRGCVSNINLQCKYMSTYDVTDDDLKYPFINDKFQFLYITYKGIFLYDNTYITHLDKLLLDIECILLGIYKDKVFHIYDILKSDITNNIERYEDLRQNIFPYISSYLSYVKIVNYTTSDDVYVILSDPIIIVNPYPIVYSLEKDKCVIFDDTTYKPKVINYNNYQYVPDTFDTTTTINMKNINDIKPNIFDIPVYLMLYSCHDKLEEFISNFKQYEPITNPIVIYTTNVDIEVPSYIKLINHITNLPLYKITVWVGESPKHVNTYNMLQNEAYVILYNTTQIYKYTSDSNRYICRYPNYTYNIRNLIGYTNQYPIYILDPSINTIYDMNLNKQDKDRPKGLILAKSISGHIALVLKDGKIIW